jgi:SAM-dependent methyltransferase
MQNCHQAPRDMFHGIKNQIDFRLDAAKEYVSQVVSKPAVLDIGGRNASSKSRRSINQLNKNPGNKIVSTDIVAAYEPDLVDDICHSSIPDGSFQGVYCSSILEHVTEYWLAVDHIYRILEKDGEAFIYVPFIWPFHDLTDHHRFTFTEVSRMLNRFSEIRIIMPDDSGYGGCAWLMMTMGYCKRLPWLYKGLYKTTNAVATILLSIGYYLMRNRVRRMWGDVTCEDFIFYHLYLRLNHGFCAWVKK